MAQHSGYAFAFALTLSQAALAQVPAQPAPAAPAPAAPAPASPAPPAAAAPAPVAPAPVAPAGAEEVTVTPAPAPGAEPPPIPIAGGAAATASPSPEGDEAVAPSAPAPEEPGATPIAGYFPGEGFALKSGDGSFKLRIGLQSAYRLEPYWIDGEPQNRRTFFVLRPFMEGYVFRDWVRFWTSFEFAANPPYLLDSFIELQPIPEFGLRIGQQWTPYSRHEYYGPQQILFPEWAVTADYFWSGRDKGITAMGVLGEDSLIEYWAGLYSGTPLRRFSAIHGNYVVEARVTVNPMGPVAANEALYITSEEPVPFRWSFTLQGYQGKTESANANFNPTSFRIEEVPTGEIRKQTTGGADIWLQGEYFTFLVEGNIRRNNPAGADNAHTQIGVWGQVGVMVVRRTMDVSLRGNYVDPSEDLDDDRFFAIEGQVGYYPFHNQNMVLKLRYAYGHQDSPDADELGAVALPAPPGTNQLLTAQLGLAF